MAGFIERFGVSPEETEENLAEFLALLDNTAITMDETVAEMEAQKEKLANSLDLVMGGLAALNKAVQERQGEFSSGHAECLSVVESFGDAVVTSATRIDDARATVEEAISPLAAEMARNESQVEADFTELSTTVAESEAFIRELNEQVVAGRQAVSSALVDLTSEVDRLRAEFEFAGKEMERKLVEMASSVAQGLSPSVESLLGELDAGVSQDQRSHIVVTGLSSTEQAVTEILDNFDELLDALGDDLISQCTGVLDRTKDHLQGHSQREVQDGLQYAAEDVMGALIADLAESYSVCNAGARVSTSLAEIVPLVVAARELMEVVNQMLVAKARMDGGPRFSS